MLQKFELNVLQNKLFSKQNTLLLAISGGIDSVVLAHLLKRSGFKFSLAHCNFKLRGKDSDADEALCKDLAKKLNVKLYHKKFDVNTYYKNNKVSIQMAARELRYSWFKELVQKNKIDFIITAHHANDLIETILINLCRGTGINGLRGIPQKTENLVRPLLNFTKEELVQFAEQENLSFRIDKSNFEAKYERNFLRLNIIPELKKLHPSLEQIFLNNVANFSEESGIVNDFLKQKNKKLVSKHDNIILLDKIQLKKEKYIKTILHQLINNYGFNASQITAIITNILDNGTSGKLFYAPSYSLTIDRKFILIKPNNDKKNKLVKINSIADFKKMNILKLVNLSQIKAIKKNELIIEQNKLIFPLIIREKRTGDKFIPFGMEGFKLVSDFLKDEKLNSFEKENCRVLENGNGEIIWIMGYRTDNRYKVISKTSKLLKLTLIE